jgi:hypothetical protein
MLMLLLGVGFAMSKAEPLVISVHNDNFLKCPFCFCMFLTRYDFDLHIACFGNEVDLHKGSVKRMHRLFERDFFIE